MTQKIRVYVESELGHEIGRFDAEFLLDFFMNEIGVYFYNQGLYDAQAMLAKRVDEISESILALEKPVSS